MGKSRKCSWPVRSSAKSYKNRTVGIVHKDARNVKEILATWKESKIDRKGLPIGSAYDLLMERSMLKLSRLLRPQQQVFINQVKDTRRKKKTRTFTTDAQIKATRLWLAESRGYSLLSRCVSSLPSVKILKQLLNKIKIEPGVSKDVFKILTEKSRIPSTLSGVFTAALIKNKFIRSECCLLFGQMTLKEYLHYSSSLDRIIGFQTIRSEDGPKIANRVTVFMLRGVLDKWIQPVAFVFTQSAMKPEDVVSHIDEIVALANEAGLDVVASVCIPSRINKKTIGLLQKRTKSLCTEKGLEYQEGIVISHGRQIVTLFDVPHLLMAFRNHFVRGKVEYVIDGEAKIASWSDIKFAYEHQMKVEKQWRYMTKLTDRHVDPKKLKRRWFSYCVQVFSHKLGAYTYSLTREGFELLPPESEGSARLVKFMNDLFDSLNGWREKEPFYLRARRMVSRHSSHIAIWSQAKEVFSSMEFVTSANPTERARPSLLRDWIFTLESFCLLRNKLLFKHGLDKFPPRSFNLDPLETFFGQVRQYRGKKARTSCIAFMTYYKSLLIKDLRPFYHYQFSNRENHQCEPLITLKEFHEQLESAPE